MTQAQFLDILRMHIIDNHKDTSEASRSFGFCPSYLTKVMEGGRPIPGKILIALDYEETKTVITVADGYSVFKTTIYTYTKKSEDA